MAEQQQDVETLKRKGRRRLVGAVALVLAAVIILPIVFDQEQKPPEPALDVRIPGENETPFKPQPAAKPASPKKGEAVTEYVVQVGAFANPEGVIAKLAGAKLPYYTEPLKGNLTRVRAGPFASKEAAEKALARLKELGLQPGAVSVRPG